MEYKKVMIVDDDKEFLDELNETLELSGYKMVAVNDPEKALEAVSSVKPDIILLDLKMPKINGFQLASEIKNSPQHSRIPIIAMSAYFRDDTKPLMNTCGIRTYLKKPFTPLDVIAEIEEALTQNDNP